VLPWAVVGPFVFIVSWVVAGALRDGYDPVHEAISRLAELGAPNRWIVTTGMATFGIACIFVGRAWKVHAGLVGVALVAAGIASLFVAAFPCTEGCPGSGSFTDVAHTLSAGTHYIAFAGGTLVAARLARSARFRSWSLAAGVAGAGALIVHATGAGPNGLFQRIGLTTLDLWLASMAWAE
jgi:hypothetical membrane protein